MHAKKIHFLRSLHMPTIVQQIVTFKRANIVGVGEFWKKILKRESYLMSKDIKISEKL